MDGAYDLKNGLHASHDEGLVVIAFLLLDWMICALVSLFRLRSDDLTVEWDGECFFSVILRTTKAIQKTTEVDEMTNVPPTEPQPIHIQKAYHEA